MCSLSSRIREPSTRKCSQARGSCSPITRRPPGSWPHVHPARLARSASPRCFLSLRRNLSMNFIHQFQSVLWSLPNQSVPFLEDPWNRSHLQSQGLSIVQAEFPNCSSANSRAKLAFQIASAQLLLSEHILIKYSTQFKYSHQCRKHPQHLLLPAALKAPQAWTQDSYHTAFLILT